MAKKNKVYIDVVVDDKGTTKRVAVDAKKLGQGLDEVATSSRNADRNLKGAANASSNATKNFSKMAQGTGGLVAAYATLAANIFAISAAYNFLKKAGDLTALSAAQQAFAYETGQSLKLLTSRLQEAAGGMLAFEEAAQAVQLGQAAGLSSDQLTGLASAAKKASLTLGRDLTDSFNRLIRGAVKAEPELLDELGIIIRLDTVTKDYAATINKTAAELTTFEKTQAVVNAVLAQSESKFMDLGNTTNEIAKLGKSFDDLVKGIQKFITPAATWIGSVLVENVQALIAAFGLLGVSIINSLTPAVPRLRDIGQETQDAEARLKQALRGGKDSKSKSKGKFLAGDRSPEVIAQLERSAKAATSTVFDYSKSTRMQIEKDLARIKQQHFATLKENAGHWQRWKFSAMERMAELEVEHGKWLGRWKFAQESVLRGIGLVMNVAAIIGMLQLAFSFMQKWIKSLRSKEVQAFERAVAKTTENFKEQNKEMEDLLINLKEGKSLMGGMQQAANLVANMSFANLEGMLFQMDKLEGIEYRLDKKGQNRGQLVTYDYFDTATGQKAGPEAKEQVEANEKLLESMTQVNESFKLVNKAFRRYGSESTIITENTKRLDEALAKIAKGPLPEDMKSYTQALLDANDATLILRIETQRIQTQMAAFVAAMSGFTNIAESFNKMVQGLQGKGSVFSEYIGQLNQIKDALTTISRGKEGKGIKEIFTDKQGKQDPQYAAILRVTRLKDADLASLSVKDAIELVEKRIKEILDDEYKIKIRGIKLDRAAAVVMTGATKLQKKKLQLVVNELKLGNEIQKVEANIAHLKKLGVEQDNTELRMQQAKLQLLEAQQEALVRQQETGAQIVDAGLQGYESGMAKSIADVLKGEESSIRDALMNVWKSVLGSVADQLAEMWTSALLDKITGRKKPHEQMKDAMNQAAKASSKAHKAAVEEGGQKAAEKIEKSLEKGAKAINDACSCDSPTIDGQDPSATGGKSWADRIREGKARALEKAKEGNVEVNPDAVDIISRDGVLVDKKVPNPNMTEQVLTEVGPRAGGLAGVLGNFTERLTGLFDGDAPFLTKLGGLFSGLLTDFGGVFQNLFSGLSGMFGAGGTGVGGFFSSMLGIFGFANGGIVKGGFRKYANGGIAKSPHIGVIGEGKYNEAVVPLPDGRSIPVQGAGMGATNNTTVNVTVDSKGGAQTSTESDSQMGDQLGKLIAKAVQEELHYQQRSGGILNPYGAA